MTASGYRCTRGLVWGTRTSNSHQGFLSWTVLTVWEWDRSRWCFSWWGWSSTDQIWNGLLFFIWTVMCRAVRLPLWLWNHLCSSEWTSPAGLFDFNLKWNRYHSFECCRQFSSNRFRESLLPRLPWAAEVYWTSASYRQSYCFALSHFYFRCYYHYSCLYLFHEYYFIF